MNLREEICEIWRNKRNVREKYKLSLTEPRNKCFGQSLIPWTHHHNQPEKNQQWTSQPQWTPSQRSRWKEFVGNQISPLKDSLESKLGNWQQDKAKCVEEPDRSAGAPRNSIVHPKIGKGRLARYLKLRRMRFNYY